MLRATTACNFSSLIWPAGSAPAALASLLFDPPEPQIIGKPSVSRLSYLFSHLHLLSSDSFSSTLLSSNLSLLSASSLLCFSSVHIVGSLTSKLPSQTLLHTEPFTHRRFYTQMLLHTEPFTHRSFYTQTLLHTDAFTHRSFYTQTLYTKTLLQKKLLHTEPFYRVKASECKSFCVQKVLCVKASVSKSF